jgi:hypothetical protein
VAIAAIATMMSVFFFVVLADFSEGDRNDKRNGAVKQYNTKDMEYNR